MAQQPSLFPTQFEFDGENWFLQYDPADPLTVKPDLSHSKIISASCDAVVIPNGGKQLWQVMVLIVIPAQTLSTGTIAEERRILGVRLFDTDEKPANIGAVNPNDLMYYVAKPRFATDVNKAQMLFNVLIGQAYHNQQKKQAVDRDWGRRLLGDMVAPKQKRTAKQQPVEEPAEAEMTQYADEEA